MEHTNYNDVHCEETIVNVPFSWEHKPGLSKVTTHGHHNGTSMVLQPPPCSSSSSGSGSDHKHKVEEESQILRAVQTSLRISSFRMESQKEEDPFVEAYKKCTRSPFIHQQSNRVQKNIRSRPNIWKYVNFFSCKHSDDVCGNKAVHTYKSWDDILNCLFTKHQQQNLVPLSEVGYMNSLTSFCSVKNQSSRNIIYYLMISLDTRKSFLTPFRLELFVYWLLFFLGGSLCIYCIYYMAI